MFKIYTPTNLENSEWCDFIIVPEFQLFNRMKEKKIIELNRDFSGNILRINLRDISNEEKLNYIKSFVKSYMIKISENQSDVGY